MELPKPDYYTYTDYRSWPDDKRCELIDGTPYLMSPSPTVGHQRITGFLFRRIADFLDGKECEAFVAPVDVRLDAQDGDGTVVQPDVIVVCDKAKIKDDASVTGAPDMAIEVLSPSTKIHDRLTKYALYERGGVKEYWIVDPEKKTIEANVLHPAEIHGGRRNVYVKTTYSFHDNVPVSIFDGTLTVSLAVLFPEE